MPEWSLPKGISLKPANGSTIHKVIDGRDTVVAEWVKTDKVPDGFWLDLRK